MRSALHLSTGTEEAAATAPLELPTPGWQELPSGGGLVFWLVTAALGDVSVRKTLERLRSLGALEAAPESGDWERRWRHFHRPVPVRHVLVRPPLAPPDPEALDVLLDVGMAFGTGSRHTTRRCLLLLQTIAPGSLLDLGCGSGVLAVAAVRFGYEPVYAVDNDEVATSAAAANAQLSGVHVNLVRGDATDPAVELPRDVILAGLLASQVEEALAAWPAHAMVGRSRDEEWCALHLRPAAGPVRDVSAA